MMREGVAFILAAVLILYAAAPTVAAIDRIAPSIAVTILISAGLSALKAPRPAAIVVSVLVSKLLVGDWDKKFLDWTPIDALYWPSLVAAAYAGTLAGAVDAADLALLLAVA